MKIAFIHYHLRPGGVTTVLKQQIEAVERTGKALMIVGELPATPMSTNTIKVPGLEYDENLEKPCDPVKVASSIIKAIQSEWKDGCDVIHIHNPTLAKNRNLIKIIMELQKKNSPLFLQIHDFAEDGRPRFYFDEDYPLNCHYGVINLRDYTNLLKAGLKKEGLHMIANTVNHIEIDSGNTGEGKHVLYPVRAIRRKNIGEAVLISMFLKHQEKLLITLPPTSISDMKSHRAWKSFVEKNNLDVEFDAGLSNDFSELVQGSRFIITTSITEGFGFSFLEAWTAKKLLWGRRLQNTCLEFENKGLQFSHLYEKLWVPVEWIGKKMFFNKWRSEIIKSCLLYNYHPNDGEISDAFSIISRNGYIDFSLLDELFQKRVILKLIANSKDKKQLIGLNPYLANPGMVKDQNKLIINNFSKLSDSYSKDDYEKNLLNIYSKIIKNRVTQKINKRVLLSKFLDLDNFSLLKWGEYEE